MMNELKAQKILPNFCCSEKRERRVMIKKNSSKIFLFDQASYRRRRATKSTLQLGSLLSPFFVHPLERSFGCIPLGAHARLPSACAFCMLLYVPPCQARSPHRNDRLLLAIGEDTSKGW